MEGGGVEGWSVEGGGMERWRVDEGRYGVRGLLVSLISSTLPYPTQHGVCVCNLHMVFFVPICRENHSHELGGLAFAGVTNVLPVLANSPSTSEFTLHFRIHPSLPNSPIISEFILHFRLHSSLPNSQHASEFTLHFRIHPTLPNSPYTSEFTLHFRIPDMWHLT